MVIASGIFEIEQEGETIVVTPLTNIGELAFQEIESGAAMVLDFLNDSMARNIVVDFHDTDYFGTTALGFFLKLWKKVSSRGGRMIFCNVSEHEKEILKFTELENLWIMRGSREAALQMARED